MRTIAQIGLITMFSLIMVFHVLVVAQIIPYTIIWGGRLKSKADMYRFELVSLTLNAAFLLIVLVKATYIEVSIRESTLNGLLWGMAAIFLLNSVGNMISKNKLERLIFTPITLMLTLLISILAIGD